MNTTPVERAMGELCMNSLRDRARSAESSWLKKNGYRDLLSKRQKRRSKSKGNKFNFYRSSRWVRLRSKAFVVYGAVCMKCRAEGPEAHMQVDHIKPRSLFPKLQYDINNIQILCNKCVDNL